MTDEEKERITIYSLWSNQQEIDQKVSRVLSALRGDDLQPGLIDMVKEHNEKTDRRLTKLELGLVGAGGMLSGLGILSLTNTL